MTTDTDTARDQAIAQLESIQAMVARLEHVTECDGNIRNCDLKTFEDIEHEGNHPTAEEFDRYHDEDEARARIDESPLLILVRSGWVQPFEHMGADEFEILLCTGGPAVCIIGELTNNEPTDAHLEYQDWGTPWTELQDYPRDTPMLISYASNFYFGE